MPRALITGITGQDGSYLAELLLDKGYEVHGAIRRTSALNRSRIDHLRQDPAILGRRLFLHYADLEDATTLRRLLLRLEPDELYHLAGQSHVGLSFEIPESTCELTALGTLRLWEMLRDLPRPPRVFHASSSEIFGRPERAPQDESTPMLPVNPYGCAKAFATRMAVIYRETYGLFIANGIMYNHESPRRGENFVTRKITRAAAAIQAGCRCELVLGDLEARRDWGHARDYVHAMWLMLQQEEPDDYVLATGETHAVREVVEIAFETLGMDWRRYVRVDPTLRRPAEPARLVGNADKARVRLGWRPAVGFGDLIREMTLADLQELETGGA